LSISIPSVLQLHIDGVISFTNDPITFTTDPLPLDGGRSLLAVFWGDVDTRGTGNVWYRLSNDPVLFDRANTEIRTAFPYQAPFNATQMYIFTWEGVGYFDSKSDQVSACTLQHTCLHDQSYSF